MKKTAVFSSPPRRAAARAFTTHLCAIILLALAVCAGAASERYIFLPAPDNNGHNTYIFNSHSYLGNVKDIVNEGLPSRLTYGYHLFFADPKAVRKEALQMGYDPENYSGMSTDELTELARNLDCRYVMSPAIDKNELYTYNKGEYNEYSSFELQVTVKILDVKNKRVIRIKTEYQVSKKRSEKYEGNAMISAIIAGLIDNMDGVARFETGSAIKKGNITIEKCYNWEALRPGDKGFVFYKDKGARKKLANVTVVSSDEKKTVLTCDTITDEGAAKKKQTLYYTFSVTDPMYDRLTEE